MRFTQPAILRLVRDLCEAELTVSRGSASALDSPEAWHAATSIRQSDPLATSPSLSADSLELLQLAGRLNQFFSLSSLGAGDNLLRKRTLGAWADLIAETLGDRWQTISFLTSGSTGAPKTCVHSRQNLLREAEFHTTHTLADARRIVTFVPSHHIYGFLFTILAPNLTSLPVLDARALGPSELAQTLQPGDALIAYPALWRYLMQSLPAFPAKVTGISSAGRLDDHLRQTLLASSLARFSEIYGSADTGGIGTRTGHETSYTLLDFLDEVSPPDELVWTGPRQFQVGRRLDHAVKIGGINVYPSQVAASLRNHPSVSDCAVRLAPGGERLKAFIVWQTPPLGSEADWSRDLRQYLSARLPAAAVPASYTFGAALPTGALGKAAAWR